MKKFKVLVISLLFVASFCTAMYAYLSDTDSAFNTVSVGSVKIELIEEFDPPEKLFPGTSFTKDVKVKNTGSNPCYVRVKAVFSDSDMERYCDVDWNKTDFVYDEVSNYWYLKSPLKAGAVSKSLFTSVTVQSSAPEASMKDFEILVYAEGFQTKGNVNGSWRAFTDYKEAWAYAAKNK